MPQPINLLYYSNALVAGHGGKLHSEAFLKEVRINPKANKVSPFPDSLEQEAGKNKASRKLKKIPFMQVLFFYRRNYKSFKEILPVLKRNKVDCLHIRMDSNFLIIDKLKKKFPGLTISTEVNASPFDENFENISFSGYFRRLEKKSLAKADANFFVSGFLREKIMEQPVLHRDFVVHNGVDLDLFSGKKSTQVADKITIGYVGTLDYHKNLKVLIDAFDKIHESHGHTRLLIIGDGPDMGDLKRYVRSKDLESVEFVGRVPHDNIKQYLDKMDIAVHHSANPYMSPLKIFEYLAAGLPVLGPDIPAVREIFEDGTDLLLVKNDVDDLTSKMKELLEDVRKRKSIAENGQKKVIKNFGWNKNADTILTVLQEKVGSKAR